MRWYIALPERPAAANGSPALREQGGDARNLAVSPCRPSSNSSRSAVVPSDPFITTPTKEAKPLARPAETTHAPRELFPLLVCQPQTTKTAFRHGLCQ